MASLRISVFLLLSLNKNQSKQYADILRVVCRYNLRPI